MRKIVSAGEMREIDRLTTERFGVPSLLLMEAAAGASARAIAAHFSDDLSHKTALILCGRGSNGGDGAALARVLWMLGVKVDLVLFGRVEDSGGDARTNFEIVRHLASFEAGSGELPSGVSFVECGTVAEWEEIAGRRRGYDLLVDALLGTGLTRPVEGVFRKVIDHLALVREARGHAGESRPLIVSLDLPSGLDADLATPPGEAVRADLTVTFTAPKPANVLPPASHFNGRLVVADIGSPLSLIDAAPSKFFLTERRDARAWLEKTRYTPDSYKNTHGHVLVIAGSRAYTGAPVLCANAAARSGAGLVTVAVPSSAHAAVASRVTPEVIAVPLAETERGVLGEESLAALAPLAERATVVAVGPGLTADAEETRRFVRELVERRTTPVVIDADGLNSLAPWPAELRGSRELPLVLTPHEGEMLRLLGTRDRSALSDRARAAVEFASAHEVVLVLKGTRALVASPDGCLSVNPTGNAGLGRGGSGDTLTGVIAGFLAQSYATLQDHADACEAVVAAVYVAGLAGDIAARAGGLRTLLASDVRDRLGEAIRTLDAEGETA